MSDYRTLVNKALRESGITQDDLTASPTDTFTTPSDPILTRFKGWVADAYTDIQLLKRDWEFMSDSGVYQLKPRMQVYAGQALSSLATEFDGIELSLHHFAGETVLTTAASGAFTVTSGNIASGVGTAEGYLTIASFDEAFFIEPGDRLVLASAPSTRCHFKRWGYYTLVQTASSSVDGIADLAEIKRDSMRITDSNYVYDQGTSSSSYSPLPFISRSDWLRYGYDRPVGVGKPQCYTQTEDGMYQFYPPPDTSYHLYFEYTRTPQTLSVATDTPTYLPSRFHDAIVWRALMYWAGYEGSGQQYNRAEKRYKSFEKDMVRDLLPPVRMSYDARNW